MGLSLTTATWPLLGRRAWPFIRICLENPKHFLPYCKLLRFCIEYENVNIKSIAILAIRVGYKYVKQNCWDSFINVMSDFLLKYLETKNIQ